MAAVGAIPVSARPVRYFVRDDDVGPLTPALRFFAHMFISREIPVSYQIIPARLTDECATFLLELQAAHPRLIEFGQHGLTHEMTLGRRRLNREFGPERTLQQQGDDIAEGLRLLRAQLGPEAEIRVFTPPQHKFDRNTVRAVAEAGHVVFSASCYPTAHHQAAYAVGRRLGLSSLRHHGISYHDGWRPEAAIREISISIDVDDGKIRKRSAGQLARATRAAAARSPTVGFMLHHVLYGDLEGAGALEGIADELAGLGAANFHKLAALAAG